MDEKRIPLDTWQRCRDQMDEAAAIYAAAVPLIHGTDEGRKLAIVGLDKMAALLQDVYAELFMETESK